MMVNKLQPLLQVCEQEFRQKHELDEHRASHLKEDPLPFLCSSCPRGFDNFEAYQEHSKEHALKRRFGCGQCGRKYDSELKLNQHMVTHANRPYTCPRCAKAFRSQHSYLKHQKMHAAENSGSGGQRFHCNLCTKQFSSAENLHSHLKNHSKPFKYERLLEIAF